MTDIPPEDMQLIAEIEAIRSTITRLQLSFANRPKNCACNGPLQMCAHHAAVYAHMDAAGDRLLFAQAQLRKE